MIYHAPHPRNRLGRDMECLALLLRADEPPELDDAVGDRDIDIIRRQRVFQGLQELLPNGAVVLRCGLQPFPVIDEPAEQTGSKNPLVVVDDADLEVAVECAVNGAFFSTGQRCTASSRLIVTAGIHDRFVAAVQARMRQLQVDDALKSGTDIGPVVDQNQLDQDLRYLEIGQQEGAELALGGERLKREQEGYYLAPALFVDTRNEMRINREEIFGPVAAVIRVKDYEEALAVANETDFGLSAGICTRSLKYATHLG